MPHSEEFLKKILQSPSGRPANMPFVPLIKAKPLVSIRVAPPATLRLIKRKVFVSFDYENDKNYRYALQMWDANKRFQFTFQDQTPQEIQSSDVGRVKAVLTTKVKEATHTLVLVGKYANQLHPDSEKIGYRNWINFEIYQSRLHKKKIIAVMLQPNNQLPEWLAGSGAQIVSSFNEREIIQALSR